jgi:hypothetical protein
MTMRPIALGLIVAMASLWTPVIASEFRVLPSGKRIEILSLGLLQATDCLALVLKYRTQMPIEDILSLVREAEEIWPIFRVDVEKGRYKCAVIGAHGPEKAVVGTLITQNQSHQIVYMKKGDVWERLPVKGANKAVETDAQGRPRLAALDFLGRRSLLR